MTKHDPVNSPKHYTSHPSGVECKDIIKHHNWSVGSAIKYLWRQGLKDGDNPVIQELRKAIKCIEIEIERIESEPRVWDRIQDVPEGVVVVPEGDNSSRFRMVNGVPQLLDIGGTFITAAQGGEWLNDYKPFKEVKP